MSQVIKKNDLELILSGAAALQAREISGEAVRKLIEIPNGNLPISAVYELAEDVAGIPREYVERYMAIRFPSRERKIKTLGEIRANPDSGNLQEVFYQEFLTQLKEKSPLEIFELSKYGSGIMKIIEDGFFYKKKKKLAWLHIYQAFSLLDKLDKYELTLNIYDAFFAEVCKEKIEEIRNAFPIQWSKFKIGTYYPI